MKSLDPTATSLMVLGLEAITVRTRAALGASPATFTASQPTLNLLGTLLGRSLSFGSKEAP